MALPFDAAQLLNFNDFDLSKVPRASRSQIL